MRRLESISVQLGGLAVTQQPDGRTVESVSVQTESVRLSDRPYMASVSYVSMEIAGYDRAMPEDLPKKGRIRRKARRWIE